MQTIEVFPGDLLEVAGNNDGKPTGVLLTFYAARPRSVRFVRAIVSVVAVCAGKHVVRHDNGIYGGSYYPYERAPLGFDDSVAAHPVVAFCNIICVFDNVQIPSYMPDTNAVPGTLFAFVPMRSLCKVLQR